MALAAVRCALRPVAAPPRSQAALVGADLTFDPRDQARLVIWLPNKLAVPSGAAVVAWPDRSGQQNHVSAAATLQALNVLGAVNGKQARRLDGVDDVYTVPAAFYVDSVTGDSTRLATFKPTNQDWASIGGAGRWWQSSLGTTNQRFYSGTGTIYSATNTLGMNVGNALVSGSATLLTTQFNVVAQQRSGQTSGAVRQWLNSLTTLDINTTWSGGGGPPVVTAAGNIGGDVNGHAQMDLSEFLIYSRQLLQAEWLRHLRRNRRLFGVSWSL